MPIRNESDSVPMNYGILDGCVCGGKEMTVSCARPHFKPVREGVRELSNTNELTEDAARIPAASNLSVVQTVLRFSASDASRLLVSLTDTSCCEKRVPFATISRVHDVVTEGSSVGRSQSVRRLNVIHLPGE